ncbi:MAG TPA: MotA/TolQ/ExbB proton channel family protein [Halothiobacillus sp.]|nr:MotA/TolQ/ExbB proton channel family protein [Halothiobacillus sp.]
MSFNMIHDVIMYAMLGMIIIATYVIVERMIYFSYSMREGKRISAFVNSHLHDTNLHAELREQFSGSQSPQGQALSEIVNAPPMSHTATEFFVQSIYVAKQALLSKRLWLLDTIVTLSPLMGLLGTIMGIIDAFHSLASNGTSDPAAVSNGIGTALFATGLGIAIALYSLAFFNFFGEKVEQINNQMKLISLKFLATK